MNTTMLVRARKHFCVEFVPRSVCRHNIRAWVRSVRQLGPRWLLASPMPRPGTAVPPPLRPVVPVALTVVRTRPRARKSL